MDKTSETLSVFFEEPFWTGVFERMSDGKLSVSKVTFGAEPKDCEVYDFILKNHDRLRFSPPVDSKYRKEAGNTKRTLREAKRQMQNVCLGTKSQIALKLQREQAKTERKTVARKERLAETERKFALKRQKRKEKHRGR